MCLAMADPMAEFWEPWRPTLVLALLLTAVCVAGAATARAEVILPQSQQWAYTTDDPVRPDLLGLATHEGRYSIALLDGCDGITSWLNVAFYSSADGTSAEIVPKNEDARFNPLPECRIE